MSSDEFLSPKEAAAMLFVTTTHLSNSRSSKKGRAASIPYIRQNKHVLYRRADVLAYMSKYPKDYPEFQA